MSTPGLEVRSSGFQLHKIILPLQKNYFSFLIIKATTGRGGLLFLSFNFRNRRNDQLWSSLHLDFLDAS